VSSSEPPSAALPRRLRALREEHWPDQAITQGQLAEALGAERSVSVPLISSWESARNPKVPPLHRLAAYATFFATRRSVSGDRFRLLTPAELTPEERAVRSVLLSELTELRNQALQDHGRREQPEWRLLTYPDQKDITIVCPELPAELRDTMPYTDLASPDYVALYRYADPDALIELYGHLRAANQANTVNFRIASELTPDDYTTHLVLLGGVDWNVVTRDLLNRVDIPVRQAARDTHSETGSFQVVATGQEFRPVLRDSRDEQVLIEDVAFFYRGPSPYNQQRTVTLFNGMYARGTLGVVRALTDTKFHVRNEDYLRERFGEHVAYSLITRVPVANGRVVTPDWSVPDVVLYEWPGDDG
jgi:transcriptional regulator with XRE-family HTH domain